MWCYSKIRLLDRFYKQKNTFYISSYSKQKINLEHLSIIYERIKNNKEENEVKKISIRELQKVIIHLSSVIKDYETRHSLKNII